MIDKEQPLAWRLDHGAGDRAGDRAAAAAGPASFLLNPAGRQKDCCSLLSPARGAVDAPRPAPLRSDHETPARHPRSPEQAARLDGLRGRSCHPSRRGLTVPPPAPGGSRPGAHSPPGGWSAWSHHERPTARPRASSQRCARCATPGRSPFWLDSPEAPAPRPALTGTDRCDLAVVGAGFTGLWTALLAKERDPGADVVVLDAGAARRPGQRPQRRHLHGLAHARRGQGAELFPRRRRALIELGMENLDAIERDHRASYGIDCGWERTGELDDRQRRLAGRRPARAGEQLRPRRPRPRVAGPRGAAGRGPLADVRGRALASRRGDRRPGAPGLGAGAGLRGAGRALLRAHAGHGARRAGAGVELRTPWGALRARRAVLATNAFRPLLRRLRLSIVPVYDYVLMTEPLSAAQLESIGWSRRQALADAGYMFHYYRLTEDQRILWGGWDAFYYLRQPHRARSSRSGPTSTPSWPSTSSRRSRSSRACASRTAGPASSTPARASASSGARRSAGASRTCSATPASAWPPRASAPTWRSTWSRGAPHRAHASSSWCARRPLPFPPEPLRLPMIEATRRSTEQAELHGGHRNLWLRTLDRFGLGFDS